MNYLLIKLTRQLSLIVALGIFCMYVLGVLMPDTFWSTHFIAFLPTFPKYGILIAVGLLIILVQFKKLTFFQIRLDLKPIGILLMGCLAFIVFYNLNIEFDYYGDAKNFSPYLNEKMLEFREGFWNELFSIKIETGHARWGVFHLYSVISYVLNITMDDTFKLMDALFGAGFVATWLFMIKNQIKDNFNRIGLVALGCTSPVVLIFCGHIETYGLVLFLIMSWLALFITVATTQNKILLWSLIPLLLICIRFYTPAVFLIPLFFIEVLVQYFPKIRRFVTIKNISLYILIPMILMGLGIYFFITKDYNDSRILDATAQGMDRLFLPLISPPAPLDTYNLLSWNHISDYLMVFFFISPGILFLIGMIVLEYKKIRWNTPILVGVLLTIVLFFGFLFMINPLMSLPMDWDLYMTSYPLILSLILVIVRSHEKIWNIQKIKIAIVLQLLAIPTFVALMNKQMHSYRIESVGVRVYKTYYQHSDSFLLYALQMLDGDELYASRKSQLLHKLAPYIRRGGDQSYAALLLDEGINAFAKEDFKTSRTLLLKAEAHAPHLKLTHEFLEKVNREWMLKEIPISKNDRLTSDSLITKGVIASRQNKMFNKALRDFKRASYYNPYEHKITLLEMEAYFLKKEFGKALQKAKKLIALKYPDEQQAYRFGIHCALEAADYQQALAFTTAFSRKWKTDTFLNTIHIRLLNNDNVDQLKELFAKQ